MLISYPVLGVVQVKESPYGGRYPIVVFKDSRHEGLTAGWHGGLHLEVNATTTQGPVVRAIADGTVVAYRVPTKKPSDPEELKKHSLNYTGNWTDDGFVILKHEKECGEERPVVFYSLYMHLGGIVQADLKGLNNEPGKPVSNPKKRVKEKGKVIETEITIKRKEVMGEAGSIEGQSNQMHFEIFTDDANFKKFFPSEPSTTAPTSAGSMDPWGEMYFLINAGRPIFKQKPQGHDLPGTDLSIPADLRIALSYHDGRACYRSLDVNGCELEHWENEDKEAEYKLFLQARELDKNKMSRSYELMRLGRFMNWPNLSGDQKPSSARCWHYLPMVDGWVDFADDAVTKLSDADFPKWCWEKVDMGKAGFDPANGLCDVSKLLSAIDENGDGHLSEQEFTTWRKLDENKALLRQMVVQFQSEWDGSDQDGRWEWIKKMWEDPGQHEQAALKRKQDWVREQKKKAETGKPELQKRIKQVTDWQAKLEGKKSDAMKALAKTQQKVDEASKARNDFINNVGDQQTNLAPTSPHAKHMVEVGKMRAALTKAVDDALDDKKNADSRSKAFDSSIERAKAWKAKEEAKLQAAEDVIKNAQPEIDQLDEAIKTAAKKTPEANAAKQAETNFEDYKKYMAALQFWQEVKKKVDGQAKKEEDKFPDSKVWHFHPLHFIEQFKKCHWLSKDDLNAVYGWRDKEKDASTNQEKRETYRKSLNRVMWKYGITTPTRMAHFLGQGGHECSTLLLMEEGGDGTQYDNRHNLGNVREGDGPLYKGRGMKQLTGCFNYVQYWVYREWLDPTWLQKVWYKRQAKNKNGQTIWVEPKDEPPVLTNPEPKTLIKDAFNCIDTGGWFWEARGGQPEDPEQKDETGVWFFKSLPHKKPINSLFIEGQIDDQTIDKISDAINPGEEGDSKKGLGDHVLSDRRLRRRPLTWHAWNALHDLPDPIPVNDDIGKSGSTKAKSKMAAGKATGTSGTPAKAATEAPKATVPNAPKPASSKSFWKRLFG